MTAFQLQRLRISYRQATAKLRIPWPVDRIQNGECKLVITFFKNGVVSYAPTFIVTFKYQFIVFFLSFFLKCYRSAVFSCCIYTLTYHGNKFDVRKGIIVLMLMEAASTSETSVDFYQTTRRYNPEDGQLLSLISFTEKHVIDMK
jgi:hypothetical protein